MNKYLDKWGDLWDRQGDYVVRRKDGNIGGWFNGQGLVRMP